MKKSKKAINGVWAVLQKFLIILPLFFLFITKNSFAAVIATDLTAVLKIIDNNDSVAIIVNFKNSLNFNKFGVVNKKLSQTLFRKKLLVSLKDRSNLNNYAILKLLSTSKSKKLKSLWLINSLAVDVPARFVSRLANLPNVSSIRLDRFVPFSVDTVATTSSVSEWNLNQINIPKLWSLGFKGKGIVVANMDTGVDVLHPELASKYRGGQNSWFDPYTGSIVPYDNIGHGTNTMGILVGGASSGTNIGLAPNARWIAAKIFNDAGGFTLSAVHLAFQWFLDPDGNTDTNDQPDVVNASWGSTAIDSCDIEFATDIEILKKAGIAVVFSAGNYGPGLSTSISPANNTKAFSVGAVDEYRNVTWFSSRGPSPTMPSTNPCAGSEFPNVVAPGINIKTTARTSGGIFPGSYSYVQGTSFAAPHVAGVMALLKNANPDISVDEMERIIKKSSFDLTNPGFDDFTGWGLVDGLAAYYELELDIDSDGIIDLDDNCTLTANIDQIDSDNDGFGNRCDPDLNNDSIVNFVDYSIFASKWLSYDVQADFNGDGIVNFPDYAIFSKYFLKPPGPSALVN